MACLHKCLYVTQMDQRAGKNTQACKHAHTPPMTYSRTRGESSDMMGRLSAMASSLMSASTNFASLAEHDVALAQMQSQVTALMETLQTELLAVEAGNITLDTSIVMAEYGVDMRALNGSVSFSPRQPEARNLAADRAVVRDRLAALGE